MYLYVFALQTKYEQAKKQSEGLRNVIWLNSNSRIRICYMNNMGKYCHRLSLIHVYIYIKMKNEHDKAE